MGGKGYLHLGAVSLVFVHGIGGHLLLLFVCLLCFRCLQDNNFML